MNTLIVDIYAIRKYGAFFIALNRLGNYMIEKTFGNTRKYMNNSIDDELFKNVLVHQVLRKEMNEALEIKKTKTHRSLVLYPFTLFLYSFMKLRTVDSGRFILNAINTHLFSYFPEYSIIFTF